MKRFLNVLRNVENNRKLQKYLLIILVCLISMLTVAYAALNTVLKITGSAEVSAAEWDIRLENPIITSGSVNSNLPVISGNKEASFSATLNNPGDFYEFSIDVVNDGSIDAMIDSITKSPTLSETQSKYLNYIVEYQNGEAISNKQLVQANSYVRLKVKVEFRKDLVASDLPTTTETLNLAFTVNYVQAEETGTAVPDNGVKKVVSVVSGDGTKTSDEVCIGEECFYVMYSDETTVTMLAKYNLYVGDKYDSTNGAVPLENPTGIQDEIARGWFKGFNVDNPLMGISQFGRTNYWSGSVESYPTYVYGESSRLYEYVENYKIYLETLGAKVDESRLITLDELESLGCISSSNNCYSAPNWVYATSYWLGSAYSSTDIWCVLCNGILTNYNGVSTSDGIRPVIVIDRSLL